MYTEIMTNAPDISTLLTIFSDFNDLAHPTLNNLLDKVTIKKYKKNDFIYLANDNSVNIFLLKEGKVKIGKYSEDGKELVLRVNHEGDIFGELSLIPNEYRGNFAQVAHGSAEVWAISIHDLIDIMQSDFQFSLRITQIIGKKLINTERRMETLIFKDAKSRIVDFIKRIADERGVPVGKETLIKTSLTHQDIAKLTATSRQTVTTTLNELKENNLIYFDRRRILIRDMAALK
jgi:CRP/FNR family transcriptional regulator, cyclic AMP receptor protein